MQCPMCQSEMKLIPPGTSKKTGKPYKGFYACQNQQCKHTMNEAGGASPSAPKDSNDEIMRGLSILRGDIKKLSDIVCDWRDKQDGEPSND